MGWQFNGRAVYAPPLLICPRCWHEANEERATFLLKPAVAALAAEARLRALIVPRESGGWLQ